MTKSEMIGKNFLELVDSIRAVRNNSLGKEVLPVTFPQLKLLRVLAKQPEGIRQKELAAALKLTPGTVSVSIELMVKQGLLQRAPAPGDRRAVMIHLAPAGRRCLQLHIDFWNAMMKELLEDIPDAEQDTFIAVFEKINAGLREKSGSE